jgi:serine protease AprX
MDIPYDTFRLRRLGDATSFEFDVADGDWLRLCLAWTDPPGRGLQHSVSLTLQQLGSDRWWYGNERRPAHLPTLDTANNLQIVRVERPAVGRYRAQVTAIGDLLWGPQTFALVCSGAVRSGLEPDEDRRVHL